MKRTCPCGTKHTAVWAELTPGDCGPLLDLGCGTGLELDRIFARWPELAVTGVTCARPCWKSCVRSMPAAA